MTNLILSWLLLSLAVYLTALVLPGFHIKKTLSVLIISALFGVLHFLLGWLFFGLLTIATLGIAWLLAFLTRIVVSAIILCLVDKFTSHLKIDGFKWALLGALTMSIIGTGLQWLLGQVLGAVS
jgi:putative membrane protein